MAKLWEVCAWEDNGYHDSYGYSAYWNGKKLETFSTWSTAYAGGGGPEACVGRLCDAPTRVRNAFKKWACRTAAEMLHANAVAMIEEPRPGELKKGETLVTTRIVRPKGKPAIPAGTKGNVFWWGSHGTFFRNGYNRPNRSNTRVGLELETGEKVFVTLEALKRVGVPESVETFEKRRVKDYNAGAFSPLPLVPCKAWLTTAYIYPTRR